MPAGRAEVGVSTGLFFASGEEVAANSLRVGAPGCSISRRLVACDSRSDPKKASDHVRRRCKGLAFNISASAEASRTLDKLSVIWEVMPSLRSARTG